MINIYLKNEIYELNKIYINLLKDKIDIININIINDINNLFNIIYYNDDINIYIDNLNEDNINTLKKINKNIYFLNISNLLTFNNLEYLNNYDIKIIDKNFLNIYILKKHKNILYLPCQISNKYIYNEEKIYDIIVLNKKSIYIKYICNQINKEVMDFSSLKEEDKYNILFKHKILLLFDDYNENENNSLNEVIFQYCIYNKVIIINDKKLSVYNDFFKDYVIDMQYKLIPKYVNYVLNNYNDIQNNLYNNLYNNLDKLNEDFGFIILRSVTTESTGKYWINSYNCIRKYYTNKIIIIDDNSNYDFIDNNIELVNCNVVKSEFIGRGEILAYYYLYKYKFFKKTVIIHDSVFINKYIDFSKCINIKFMWYFTHHWDNELGEIEMINKIENNENINKLYHKKNKWFGCFGLQSIIDLDFLEKMEMKYNIFNLLEYIKTREIRMDFERIFGLLCFQENKNLINDISMYGIIHHYIHWGYTYDSYINDIKTNKLDHLDIVKVWTGR
jgi:hypothetical protein